LAKPLATIGERQSPRRIRDTSVPRRSERCRGCAGG
jgi:hypothetical protein